MIKIEVMKIFLVIAFTTVAFGIKIDPFKYLTDYGYLEQKPGSGQTGNLADLGKAILNFQKFAHIPETGLLDDATLNMMQKPRCGVKDVVTGNFNKDVRRKRYVASSRYWVNRVVTYSFINYNVDLGRSKTRKIIELALETWSNVTNLSFKELTGNDVNKATMRIKFQGGNHGCPYPFDGRGGVLAHAFYPHDGRVHFDEDEEFTDGENRGRNLFWVAAHEFGHALGLPHSDVYEALMYPWYKGYKADFKLPTDDIGAIRALYGCKNTNISPVQIPQDSAPYNGLLMERWSNVQGEGIHHIEPGVCIYPHQPDSARILQKFEAPSNDGDDFATRIRGYIKVNKRGYYRFYLCADHSAKLYLSKTRDPQDKHSIISVTSPTGKNFNGCKSGVSTGYLYPGKLYYIEAIQKDNNGNDFLQVGFRYNGDKTILPVTSADTKWALIDTEISQMICKGRYETLICPASTEIEITKASYGLSSSDHSVYYRAKRTCNFDWWSESYGIRRRDCEAKSSLSVVRKACHAKQQCTLYAHDSVFTDHCGKLIYSVLSVTYRCVSKGTATIPPPSTTAPPTTTLPPTTTKAKCEDKYRKCSSWKKAGHCSYDHIRNDYCRLTCGVCVGTTPRPTTPSTSAPTTTPATTTKAKCQDKYPECPTWAKGGFCSYGYIRNNHCRLSCKVCVGPSTTAGPTTTSAPTTPAPCKDQQSNRNCLGWQKAGYCKASKRMRERYCRKTCGTCV